VRRDGVFERRVSIRERGESSWQRREDVFEGRVNIGERGEDLGDGGDDHSEHRVGVTERPIARLARRYCRNGCTDG